MAYVFDSSFVAALIIPDEKNMQARNLYDKISNESNKYVPQLLWYEMANIYRNLILRKRYTSDEVIQFFSPLAAFRLVCDSEAGIDYSRKLFRLCNDYNLSSYDAAYLELAKRKGAVLCTLDENLLAAATRYGVVTLE